MVFLLWYRSLDFTVSLLQKSKEEPKLRMEQAVEDAYNLTLKPWHGWISSAAYKVILLLHPYICFKQGLSLLYNQAVAMGCIHPFSALFDFASNLMIMVILYKQKRILWFLQIALKLVPDSETFANLLMAKDEKHETLVEEIDSFVSQLSPFLEDIHNILVNRSITFSIRTNSMTVYQLSMFMFFFSETVQVRSLKVCMKKAQWKKRIASQVLSSLCFIYIFSCTENM